MMTRLSGVGLVFALLLAACGGSEEAASSTAAAETTTTSQATTTSMTPTTSLDTRPSGEVFGEFLTTAFAGSTDSLGELVPADNEYWASARMASLIDFLAVPGLGSSLTVTGCEVVETAESDVGVPQDRVECVVSIALLDAIGAEPLAQATEGVAAGLVTQGAISDIDPIPVAEYFDTLRGYAHEVDAEGFEAACVAGSEPAHKKIGVYFHAECGVFLGSFLADFRADAAGQDVTEVASQYAVSCARCHGADLAGTRFGFSLVDSVAKGLGDDLKREFISMGGHTNMPAFPRLSAERVEELIAFIREAQAAS